MCRCHSSLADASFNIFSHYTSGQTYCERRTSVLETKKSSAGASRWTLHSITVSANNRVTANITLQRPITVHHAYVPNMSGDSFHPRDKYSAPPPSCTSKVTVSRPQLLAISWIAIFTAVVRIIWCLNYSSFYAPFFLVLAQQIVGRHKAPIHGESVLKLIGVKNWTRSQMEVITFRINKN